MIGLVGHSFAGELRALNQQAGRIALVRSLKADKPDIRRQERFDDAARQHVCIDFPGSPVQVRRQPDPVVSTYNQLR